MTPAGIEPATFRFVAEHLNHCATAVPKSEYVPVPKFRNMKASGKCRYSSTYCYPRHLRAWDSHMCVHTSRAMNVASSRAMFAAAVGGGRGAPTSWALRTVISNRSTWAFETAWEYAFPEPSIFIAEWSQHNIMSQYEFIFHMFSYLNFVCISRLFPVRAVCPSHLHSIYLVTLIFSKVKCYKLWLFACSSSFLFLPAYLPRRLL